MTDLFVGIRDKVIKHIKTMISVIYSRSRRCSIKCKIIGFNRYMYIILMRDICG